MAATKKTKSAAVRIKAQRAALLAQIKEEDERAARLELSEEQKDALRALFDGAEAEANRTDLSGMATYRRIGIATGIERAARALGFDLYDDWRAQHKEDERR